MWVRVPPSPPTPRERGTRRSAWYPYGVLHDASVTFKPGPLRGELRVPGDKSISHRALIVGGLSPEPLHIANLNPGRDLLATRRALEAIGVRIDAYNEWLVVSGGTLHEPLDTIDCMNSGSTARMMLGVLAGANLRSRLDGDASLRRRPMEPVAAQLRAFGAKIDTTDGKLPLALHGTPRIETTRFILLTGSAQIKSALLFAGLFAGVPVTLKGGRGSRDHTERMLRFLGATIEQTPHDLRLVSPPVARTPIDVPGDFSSAAFFIVAATITPGSRIEIRDVGVNPTRTGLLEALLQMGAKIELRDPRERCGEPIADLVVEHAPLHGIAVPADMALRAIDDIQALTVAAAFAQGTTRITGIGDLRAKESDRVAAIERLLGAVGIRVETLPNGIEIHGGLPQAPATPIVSTHGDHRTAMAAAALACAAGPIAIDEDAADVSYPEFGARLRTLQQA